MVRLVCLCLSVFVTACLEEEGGSEDMGGSADASTLPDSSTQDAEPDSNNSEVGGPADPSGVDGAVPHTDATTTEPGDAMAATSEHPCDDGVRKLASMNGDTTCVVWDGALYCWGLNDNFQLVDGTTINRASPQRVKDWTDVTYVGANRDHVCAVRTNGCTFCWGDGITLFWYGGFEYGDAPYEEPAEYPEYVDAVSVVPTRDQSLTLKMDMTIGGEYHDLRLATHISAFYGRTCVTQMTGRLWCYELATDIEPPILREVRASAVGDDFSCALMNDGTVRCWGDNASGQLGLADVEEASTPTTVPGLTDVAQLAAGRAHACARRTNGEVLCWGDNAQQQLGRALDSPFSATPTPVPDIEGAFDLEAGYDHTCVLSDVGIQCWGANSVGQLGSGEIGGTSGPVLVALPPADP